MKIVELIKDKSKQLHLEVNSAEYVGDFTLLIGFNDGCTQKVSFKSFLKKTLHPEIKKYYKESNFKKYKIVDGNINWNDYDMIFPVEDLYEGKV
jgi:hypothetical protein